MIDMDDTGDIGIHNKGDSDAKGDRVERILTAHS